MVGPSSWCLHSPWLSLQQKFDGSWWWSWSVVEPSILTWGSAVCKSSCITSPGCEVFRGIAEVCHWWHTRLTILTNTSQATENLVLDDCKKCESREEQGQLLDRAIGVNQRQNTCQQPSFFVVGEFWRRPFDDLLHLVLLIFGSSWGTTSIN
jgi:hypothetical protein